jgi:uncharacterized protein YecE (DUF72 family)
MNVRVGCCGFAGSRASYFKRFPVVEVQQTFYEPPRLSTAQRWRTTAPADFEFTLKAWQLITHEASSPTYRRLRTSLNASTAARVGRFQPTNEVWNAWGRTREIAAALRARVIVFQCPASFKPTQDHKKNLRRFFQRVRSSFAKDAAACPILAWEPRGDWSDAEVKELCDKVGLVHVVDPFVRMPVTTAPFYFRLHGIGGYRHKYSEAELHRLAKWTRSFGLAGYCLFNNLSMRDDALRFQRILGSDIRKSAV